MKSRITTYVLIAAVIAVWGFIAWKIFFARPIDTTVSIQRAPDSGAKTEEEQHLILDYKDPFLKDAGAAKASIPAARPIRKTPAAAPSKKPGLPKEAPPMKYTGTIGRGGRISYIFEHAGLQQALAPGEELSGFRLTEVWADSVKLTKDGDSFTLHIQN